MSAPRRDLITHQRMNRAGNIENYQLRGYGSGFGIKINRNIEFRQCSDNATSNDVTSDLNGPRNSSAAGAAARHQLLNRNSSTQVPESLPSTDPPPIEPASPSPPRITSIAPVMAPVIPPSTMPAMIVSLDGGEMSGLWPRVPPRTTTCGRRYRPITDTSSNMENSQFEFTNVRLRKRNRAVHP